MKFSKTSIWVIAALSLLSLGSVLVLHLAGFRFFTISTPSMGETAPVGTLIVTQPQQSYNKDDIITFYRSGSTYTHRLVKVNDDHSYTTKGDLNAAEDSLPVANRDVIGKAVVIKCGDCSCVGLGMARHSNIIDWLDYCLSNFLH